MILIGLLWFQFLLELLSQTEQLLTHFFLRRHISATGLYPLLRHFRPALKSTSGIISLNIESRMLSCRWALSFRNQEQSCKTEDDSDDNTAAASAVLAPISIQEFVPEPSWANEIKAVKLTLPKFLSTWNSHLPCLQC